MAASPASFTSERRYILNVLFAFAGGALLYLTVRRVGWSDVQSSVTALGWWYAVVLLLGGGRFAVRAMAWTVCARPEALRFQSAFAATLAGDALGNLTPLGLLASEPAKVLLVRRQLPMVAGVASLAAENAFYTASVLVMISAGAVAFFRIAEVPQPLAAAAQAVLVVVVAAALAATWLARRQPALLTRLAHTTAALTGRTRIAADRLREIEVRFYALISWPAGRIARVVVWELLFHAGAVAEVFVVMQAITTGTTLVDAFVLETAGRLIVVAFKFIPYRLGVDEAGTALVAAALGIDPAVGVSLALVRRLRILVWNGVGLVLLAARPR